MPKLTDADRSQIKAKHPDAVLLRTPAAKEHDFVFRPVGLAEFDMFLSALNGGDETAKNYAHRQLARDTVLFPPVAEWDALATSKPGVAHALGYELSQRTGLGAEVESDAL